MRKLENKKDKTYTLTNDLVKVVENVAIEKDWSDSKALRFILKYYAEHSTNGGVRKAG